MDFNGGAHHDVIIMNDDFRKLLLFESYFTFI
jgi:hypothetical protein